MAPTFLDFNNGPIVDFGESVTRTPVTTAISNIGGQKTYSDGTDETITVLFQNPGQNYGLDKSGETEQFDAVMFIKYNQTMNKRDKITHKSKIYRVHKVSPRDFGGNVLFKMVGLFFIE